MYRTVTTTLSKLSNTLNTNGVIPFFYHQDIDRVLEVMKILKRCGCNVFEFTHQRDARGIRMFTWLAEKAKELDIIIGAGTVRDASQANRFIQAGAHFIASPFLHADVARVCHENNVIWIPGCSTFQDVAEAKALQASLVTILPGNILGPAFLKQVVNVHPEISFIPSGGVTLVKNNQQGWFDAGALCVRLGESLFTREDVAVKDWVKVEGNVYRALQGIRQIKTSILRTKSITISE